MLAAYFDGGEQVSAAAACVVDEWVHSGRNAAIISTVTAMELLVRPLRLGAREPYQHVIDFLHQYPNLRILPADLTVAQEAASLRAVHRLSETDALIVATGLVSQVSVLLTNDARWKAKLRPLERRISTCLLSDHMPFP
ncbi:MAG: PilT protein domain protein [Chloroflexi bacterium]|nr:PilT protein domain protein [Chloroflexota bacterium]